MLSNIVFVLISLIIISANAENWCVIVAGSNSYANYRHQADAAHAYHVCVDNGVPTDNIILMMYDDAANAFSNPFRGALYNDPQNPINYYEDLVIEYKGDDVTPENFISVITGRSDQVSGRVLKSTSADNVFINFVDHGGPGIICFPRSNLYADDLLNAFKTMYNNKMYNKLVFYLEACESGSMFNNDQLASDMNIYAVTAADPNESSWGTFCPPDDVVNGKDMRTCLGDLFSVNWMENIENVGTKQTFEEQYEAVRDATNKSHVMQYGETDWTTDLISEFFGNDNVIDQPTRRNVNKSSNIKSRSAVKSRDIPMHLAYYDYLRHNADDFNNKIKKAEELLNHLTHRTKIDKFFYKFSKNIANNKDHYQIWYTKPSSEIIRKNAACAKYAFQAYERLCGKFEEYDYNYYRLFHNACELKTITQYDIEKYLKYECSSIHQIENL